ncbi:MAG: hypothetical protein RLY31_322 [Bacteroidota bacterium]
MKRIVLLGLLTSSLLLLCQQDALAQQRGKKKKSSKTDEYFDDSGFLNKLWYGGTLSLPNFFGGGEYNIFSTGIAPMVGYKVIGDMVSVGPRISLDYLYVRGFAINQNTFDLVRDSRGNPLTQKVNTVSYSLGAFARAKVFRALFAHLEYENQHTRQVPVISNYLIFDPVNDEILTEKSIRNNVYVGAGYNTGSGLLGWELLLLYNLNAPENTIDLPFTFRIGLNYKF